MKSCLFAWVSVMCLVYLTSLASARNPRSWSFNRGDRTTFITPDEKHFQGVSLNMMDRKFFTFRVRACWDAHIYLSRLWNEFSTSTEIIIGGWKNKRSAIRLNPGTSQQKTDLLIDTMGILSCEESRQFWISWKNASTLYVGRGPTFGQHILIAYKLKSNEYYRWHTQLKFASGWGAQATWQILDNSAETMLLKTTSKYSYNNIWKTTAFTNKFYTFEVKACNDAHIALSETVGVFRRRAHEIVIGGWNNTKSVIRWRLQGGNPPAINITKNLLNCNQFRSFWVSWQDNTIMAGMGTIYNKDVLLKYGWKRPLRPINAIGFSTGFGAGGEWIFLEDKENSYIVDTPQFLQGNIASVTTSRQFKIRFYIQSCGNAEVLLTPDQAFTSGNRAARLVIGADSNTRTYIREFGSSTDAVSQRTRDILECRRSIPFWITWDTSGQVKFGKATADGTLLTWNSKYSHINAVGFNSPNSASTFKIFGNQAEWVNIAAGKGAGTNYISVHQEYHKVFRVKACNEAKISLFPEDGTMSNKTYAIFLGYYRNGFSAIYQTITGGANAVSKETPGILSCDELRAFWVSWLDGVIRVGRGWNYGADEIMSMDQVLMYEVRSVVVESNDGQPEQWQFEEDRGDKIRINTTMPTDYQWFKYGGDFQWMSFQIQGSDGARIALAREYHNNPSSMYQIYIGDETNTKTKILKGSNVQKTASSKNVLNDTQPRDFWVSWENGVIAVGSGSVKGIGQIASWQDSNPHEVGSIGLASSAKTVVQWKFSEMDVDESTIELDPNMGFRQFWLHAKHRTMLLMGVTGCKGLRISLATILGFNATIYQYEIGILTNDLQQSFIRSGKRNEVLVQQATPYAMNCNEERFLWLSWYSGVIIVGKGTTVGKRVMMTLHDMNALQIAAVGFMVDPGQTATIRILHDADQQIGTFTDLNRQLPLYGALSGGEKAAAAIGFLALFALFGLAVYVVLRPPEALKPLVTGQSSPTAAASSAGFSNPQFEASTSTSHET